MKQTSLFQREFHYRLQSISQRHPSYTGITIPFLNQLQLICINQSCFFQRIKYVVYTDLCTPFPIGKYCDKPALTV